MDCLTIGSYNCKHFSGHLKTQFTKCLFEKCDILCIQEHWLYESQVNCFNEIDRNIVLMKEGCSAMDPSILRHGRPHGGCMILWNANIKYKVVPIGTVSKRLCCVQIWIDENVFIMMFNVYMPCDDRVAGDNLREYQDVLTEISAICQSYDVQYILLCGDFNTDFNRQTPQVEELTQFCLQESITPCVKLQCSNIEYTFECKRTGNRSIIDHVLLSDNMSELVHSYNTIDNIDNQSDHIAVIAELGLQCQYMKTDSIKAEPRIAWYKADLYDIDKYKQCLDNELDYINVSNDVIDCQNTQCTSHFKQLEQFHDDIIQACLTAAKHVLPSTGASKSNNGTKTPIPGWNEHVAVKKGIALDWHWRWVYAGKPHIGQLSYMRRVTRLQYHYAVRAVKKHENVLRSERMIQNCVNNNNRQFWKEAKKMKCNSNRIPNVIDNVSGADKITGLFKDKYNHLYNSVSYDVQRMNIIENDVNCSIKNMSVNVNECIVDRCDVYDAIKRCAKGKHDGNIGLFSDHIIHGTPKLYDYIARLFTSMILHGFSPTDMLMGTMIPIPKNKRVSVQKSDQFRAICLQSVLCKILDIIIIVKENDKLLTSELQFGFKKKVSAALATTVVLETVDYYTVNGGNVYGLALDASKAFDRVEYTKLFECLIDRKVNPLFIRLLLKMYVNQKLRVKFNQSCSTFFSVSNGVKQGGVLSPTLFGIYVNGLLERLEKAGYGCYIGRLFYGVIGYADDIILLAPTQFALRNMIRICEEYAIEYNIVFNGAKSKLIVFGGNSDSIRVNITVNNARVDRVSELNHLGTYINQDGNNPMVGHIVRDFNVKINTFLTDFGGANSMLKNMLFDKYCLSLYGSQHCMLSASGMNDLYISWRKAIRRIWRLPYRAHNRLLPLIADHMPLDVMLQNRFINYYLTGFHHDNEHIRFIFRTSLYYCTRLCKNIVYVAEKIKENVCDIVRQEQNNVWKKNIMGKWSKSVDENDYMISMQVRELVHQRDTIDPWLLDNNEIEDIIFMLTVT